MGKKLIALLVVLIVAVAGFYIHGHQTAPKSEYPEYLNFAGNYVFSVPKDYRVDEQAVPGLQLVYIGIQTSKTLEDLYKVDGLSLQQISDLSDHSGKAFKKYVNNSFLRDIKKNLSTDDVQVKFGKTNGWDVARATVKKDGAQVRFVYLKNGRHPATIVSKNETDAFKKIEQTITDVENSDLKNEQSAIKQSIQTTIQLAKDQKAPELYNGAASELRSKNTQEEVKGALTSATPHLKDNIVISGVTYSPGGFAAGLRFTSISNRDAPPSFGVLVFKKADGQWKLEQLSLPAG